MNRKQNMGFTLIESMMVVAIIGILASVSLPAYQQYSNRARFAEALLATSVYRNAIVVSANARRFNSILDVQEGTNGIPAAQERSETAHGIHVHEGQIIVSWRKDGSTLDGINYTLTAQSIDPPIRWTEGGTCQFNALC